jgi:putative Mg2+ transporter-C (MgtC) family protein
VHGPSELEIIGRLLLAAVLGGVVGAEREIEGKDAGLRTHIMLSLGAAVFGVISVGAWDHFITSQQTNVSVDVSRVASYVAAGVGFIGGGTIIKQSGGVRGLTTAASLWVVAAGLGMWLAAITATLITLFSLVAVRPVRALLRRSTRTREGSMVVQLRQGASPSSVLLLLEDAEITPAELSAGPGTAGTVEVVVTYEPYDPEVVANLARRVGGLDDVTSVVIGRA